MKKRILITVTAAALVFGFCSHSWMSTIAKENGASGGDVYYTSIEIREGDSLWSVANIYASGLGLSTDEYIANLKEMNRLEDDTIHAGHYLTVMYRADES